MSPQWNYYPITTLPAPLDVVWSHFPFDGSEVEPGPVPHPALIAQTALNDGKPQVLVIYGTSNMKLTTRPHDFFICNSSELDEAGLKQNTRFDMDRYRWLPWAEEWFRPINMNYESPVLGRLSQNGRNLLNALIKERKRLGLD